jgi:bacterioferritin-associated ferredoxin
MLVCHCKALSEHEIRRLIRQGVRSLREIVRGCGAGAHCGGCRPLIAEILESERAAPKDPDPLPSLRAQR